MELGNTRISKLFGVKLMAHGFQSDSAAQVAEVRVGRVPVRTVKGRAATNLSLFVSLAHQRIDAI
jgi:hypothetical protein